jgi:hypothetical protein
VSTFLSGAQSQAEFKKIIDDKLTIHGKSQVAP